MIPLNRMGEYTDGIERINIELSLKNKLQLVDALEAFFRAGNLPLGKTDDANEIPSAELLEDRVQQALELPSARARWEFVRDRFDQAARGAHSVQLGYEALAEKFADRADDQPGATVFHITQDRTVRISWKQEIRAELRAIFNGGAFKQILDEAQAIHKQLRGRVFVALHMHAGDGNVHTNPPVNSDNYEMLQDAHAAVARIMTLARSLDGVISGEHGIGITKLEFLTDDDRRIPRVAARRPERPLQQGQAARRRRSAQRLYAELRADGVRVADHEQSDIGAIADSVKDACAAASRCARRTCRARTCCTAAQQDPRNLAAGRGVPVRGADAPRRVDQALGRVQRRGRPLHGVPQVRDAVPGEDRLRRRHTMNMRNLLRKMGKKKFNAGNAAGMFFLNATNPQTINVARSVMMGAGGRFANDMLKKVVTKQTQHRPRRSASRRWSSR